MSDTFTKADYSRSVGVILRAVAAESAHLAKGSWNASFSAADGTLEARRFCAEIRAKLDHLERRAGINAITAG
jgi:hypothetical protein